MMNSKRKQTSSSPVAIVQDRLSQDKTLIGTSPSLVENENLYKQTSIHIVSHHEQSSNKLVEWVHRLEKLNANNQASAHRHSTTVQSDTIPLKVPTEISHLASLAKASITVAAIPVVSKPTDGSNPDQDDLCFKASQLATEFILMLFAASLLIIAAIVIISAKKLAFMESYEIVPKFLFFMCVFVAIYSFFSWIIVKIEKKFGLLSKSVKYCCPAKRKSSTKRLEDTRQNRAPQMMRQKQLISSDNLSTGSKSLDEEEAARKGCPDSSACKTTRCFDDVTKQASGQAEDGPKRKLRGARFVHARSCPPPTRQVAFDSSNLLFEQDETIDEESERSFASA